MRKIFKFIILFVFIAMFFPMISKAESINYECHFDGTIVPKNKFMIGDSLLLEDFEINGQLICGNEIYDLEALDFYINSVEKFNNITKETEVSADFVVFVIKNRNYSCHIPVTITYIPFNPKITCQLDGQVFTVEKLHWKSEDGFDTISYMDELDKRVLNILGREIQGTINFNGKAYAPYRGYNTVKYRFKPIDKRYDDLYGEFTVVYSANPYMVVQKDSINIHLQESIYKVYLNGKLQKDHFIDNLKPNTKYKIVVKQKKTPVGNNITIWSGTVKTKK